MVLNAAPCALADAMNQATRSLPNLDGRAFINGQRCWAHSGARFDNISPVNGQLLCEVARCDGADIDLAVRAARQAFEDKRWQGLAPAARKRILIQFADLILAHAEELALLETLDMGKPIQYARQVDVNSTANCIRWYGEAIDKVYDEIAPTPAHALALITREPMGVVGVIVPWNYPMIMAAWKIAPALACGNSVVLKPSEKSPLSALRLAELAMAAGMLPSAYSLGDGGEFRAPMAIAVISGLLVSTVLSLVFVPSFYVVMDDLSRLVSRMFAPFLGKKEDESNWQHDDHQATALPDNVKPIRQAAE
jgi:gamma-glutamyl-gamma-aminobutyraldehyde dehydrogenase/4-guanidinobutyraldehyde dehydrogenase/NAD-dependent aldehyde dehydrogenase